LGFTIFASMLEILKRNWKIILFSLLALVVIIIEARTTNDFDIFLAASRDLLAGNNFYELRYIDGYRYYYDVSFALIIAPLTFIPVFAAKFLWLSLDFIMLYRIWQILKTYLPISEWSKKSLTLFTFVCFFFVMRLLRDNLHLAQVTILILYLSLEGLYRINKKQFIIGGLLLAWGITIKLMPLVFIPYLLYRKEWKATFVSLGFVMVLLLAPALIIGSSYNTALLESRWNLINPQQEAHILDTSEVSFHSLTTVCATLFVEDCKDQYALDLKRNIADISIDQLKIVINVVRLILILLTLYFLSTKPFVSKVSSLQRLYEISYLCMVVPLIFPHQQPYAFFFSFPAIVFILFDVFQPYKDKKQINKWTVSALGLIFLLINIHFIVGAYGKYYSHFKIMTYGILLLVVLLALKKSRVIAN
jgi:Glycosyltransferase family 87